MRPLVLALLVVFAAKPADACSCLRRQLDDAYRAATYVMVAKVLAQGDDHGEHLRTFELEVEGVWKGPARHAMRVATGHGGGDCGRRLAPDQRWILFARELADGTMVTSICDFSHPASKAAITAMTKKFGAPKNPKR